MAKATRISNAAAIAACDALVDLLDGGAGAGTIKIYTGTQATDPDTAIGAQVLLGTLTCSDPAFGNAADATPGATATASAITSDTTADATGTATWFRAADSNGTAIIDGSIGLSATSPIASDMQMDDTSVVAGGTIAISAWTVTMPES